MELGFADKILFDSDEDEKKKEPEEPEKKPDEGSEGEEEEKKGWRGKGEEKETPVPAGFHDVFHKGDEWIVPFQGIPYGCHDTS